MFLGFQLVSERIIYLQYLRQMTKALILSLKNIRQCRFTQSITKKHCSSAYKQNCKETWDYTIFVTRRIIFWNFFCVRLLNYIHFIYELFITRYLMCSWWFKSYLLKAFRGRVFKKGINQLVSHQVSNGLRMSERIVLHLDKKRLHRDLYISKRKSRALLIVAVCNPC